MDLNRRGFLQGALYSCVGLSVPRPVWDAPKPWTSVPVGALAVGLLSATGEIIGAKRVGDIRIVARADTDNVEVYATKPMHFEPEELVWEDNLLRLPASVVVAVPLGPGVNKYLVQSIEADVMAQCDSITLAWTQGPLLTIE